MSVTFLYRDTVLPQSFISEYTGRTAIFERGYVEASKLRGGPFGNVRYIFLNDNGLDIAEASQDNQMAQKFQPVLFKRDGTWYILDIYQKDDVTQILLSLDPGPQDELVAAARTDLDSLINEPPVDVLQEEQWRERVTPPLGLSDEGVPFPFPEYVS